MSFWEIELNSAQAEEEELVGVASFFLPANTQPIGDADPEREKNDLMESSQPPQELLDEF